MAIKMNPQEIYLLARYSSRDYFGELRDTWTEVVKHVEKCLALFMQNVPTQYRSHPLREQPDIVWGEKVLPNFRDTLEGLYTGYILLSHGDVKGLQYAWGPRNDFIGQKDYSSVWMGKGQEELYGQLLIKAGTMAANICTTERAGWKPLSLPKHVDALGETNFPVEWPAYRINRNVSVHTGGKIKKNGIYVPTVGNSCAEFLCTNYEHAPAANVLLGFDELIHPTTGEKYGEQPLFGTENCVWYAVEDSTDCEPQSADLVLHDLPLLRVASGEPCPETGFYFTPARSGSRRLFEKGIPMPELGSAYGLTIWQWDSDQT